MLLSRTSFQTLALTLIVSFSLSVPAEAQRPYAQPDDTWITISGTVETVTNDAFTLDYGRGLIAVEMDDGDRDADAYKLVPGDEVTVSGMIDDDFFEARTIEASSVYVEKLGTTFFASAVDEEDLYVTVKVPFVSGVAIQGTVTDIAGEEEFVVNTGVRRILVETDALPYDPLDDVGYQQIDVGDRVSVTGWIDNDFLEGREVVADSILELSSREADE